MRLPDDAGVSVSALSIQPTFECTADSIHVDQVQLNDNIGTVFSRPRVEVWSGGQWVFAAINPPVNPAATVDTDNPFSELTDPTFDFTAQTGTTSECSSGPLWAVARGADYPAQALQDAVGDYFCQTS